MWGTLDLTKKEKEEVYHYITPDLKLGIAIGLLIALLGSFIILLFVLAAHADRIRDGLCPNHETQRMETCK